MYDQGEDGNLVVNPKQAQIVKRIYSLFLQGKTYYAIAKQLTVEGISTPGGKTKWRFSGVQSILRNEKYKGDSLLQKTYTVDFLSKKINVNEGEIPQYYVENNHKAIISHEMFDLVRKEMLKHGTDDKYNSCFYPFSSKIKCGCSGNWYGSKVWHSNSKYRKVVWQCNHKFDNDERCNTPHLYEDDIKAAFLSVANQLLSCKDSVIANVEEMMAVILDTTALEKEQDELLEETQLISEMVQAAIRENATVALDQTEYQKRYDSLSTKFDKSKARLEQVMDNLQQMQLQRAEYESFLKTFKQLPDSLEEFSIDSWNSLVEYATVYSADDIRFTFKNDQESKE